jgi:phosphatidylglycerophosphatase A
VSLKVPKKPVQADPILNPFSRVLTLGAASGLGLGYAPIAPGTFGSLLGIPLGLWILQYPTWIGLLICCLLFIPFTWAAGRAGSHWGDKDSGKIVIDEVLGQALALIGMKPILNDIFRTDFSGMRTQDVLESVTFDSFFELLSQMAQSQECLVYIGVAFLLFRIFDIVKPFPARNFDRQASGFGNMMDDVVAGLYAAIAVRAIIKIFG